MTPAVAPVPVTNESPLPTQPEMMANVPLSNGRSQTPEQMDEMVCTPNLTNTILKYHI